MKRFRAGSVRSFLALLILMVLGFVNSQDISNTGTAIGASLPEPNLGANQRTVADLLSTLKSNNLGPYPSSGPNFIGQDGSSFAEAQAKAQASSDSSSSLNQELDSYEAGILSDSKSAAAANSFAEAISGSGQPSNPFSPGLYPYSGPGLISSQAQAQAQAEAISGGSNFKNPYSPGLNQYFPGSLSPGYSAGFATSSAQSEAYSGGYSQPINPYSSNPYSYPSSNVPGLNIPGYGSSSAQALADASSAGGLIYPGISPGYSQVLAQAQADASSNVMNPLGPYSSLVPAATNAFYPGGAYGFSGSQGGSQGQANAQTNFGQAQAEALSQALSYGGQSSENANAVASVNSRPVPHNEYVPLNNIPGGYNVACTRTGELHYVWTDLACLVCACVRDSGYLTPICVSCSGCVNNLQPTLRPPPPPPAPIRTTTTPMPINCSPLPRGQPFPNPLHPCQICICQESVNAFGQPDVQIECQNNPQCVLPPDVTTLPPLPGSSPVPLPLCEKFPQNVMFPHPSDACSLCYCSVRVNEYEYPEEHITCQPNPACLEPGVPITIPPVTPEPNIVPWTIPTPAPPGPLPGPSPHESCRPYVPNQPFQHPWDECQICVCTEAFSVGLITIEVNCFTKKSCCYEYAEPSGQVYPGGFIGSAEASASANAQSNFKQLPSYPSGNHISPNYIISGGSSQASAEAIASAQSQSNQFGYPGGGLYTQGNEYLIPVQVNYPADQLFLPVQDNIITGGNHIGQGGLLNAGSKASASAEAQAQMNQGFLGYPGYPSYQGQGHSSAEADALSNHPPAYNGYGANYAPGYSNPLTTNPGFYGNQGPNFGYPGINSAEAVANANAQTGFGQADAFANAVSNSYGVNGYPIIASPIDGLGYGQVGVPSPVMYSDLYPQPSYDLSNFYSTGKGSENGYIRGPVPQGVYSAQQVRVKSGEDNDNNIRK